MLPLGRSSRTYVHSRAIWVLPRPGSSTGAGLSSACTIALVRAILRKCANAWEWLDRSPSARMLKESRRRIRFLTREEAQTLLAKLPEHLSAMATFSLATGLRRANVTGLQWTQVDVVRRLAWIHPDQAKARKAIAVPLNADAVALLRKRVGTHPTHVFSFQGKPIVQVSTTAWYAALKRAGICNFRWHDLRHVGQLARAKRYTTVCTAGVGRLGKPGDGAPVRAPCRRTPGTLCRSALCIS